MPNGGFMMTVSNVWLHLVSNTDCSQPRSISTRSTLLISNSCRFVEQISNASVSMSNPMQPLQSCHNMMSMIVNILFMAPRMVYCSIINNLFWSLMLKIITTFRSVSYGPCSCTGPSGDLSHCLFRRSDYSDQQKRR